MRTNNRAIRKHPGNEFQCMVLDGSNSGVNANCFIECNDPATMASFLAELAPN